ncbi:hypothetical protein ABK040_000689 [Willaertia magna]
MSFFTSQSKKFIPHSERDEFKDIQPIEQDEGQNPIVRIAYTDEFKDTMNYFRSILQLNEMSERSLKLTEEVIELNPANYTAWHYRRKILFNLNLNLKDELNYLNKITFENQKNYQVWYHRQSIIEKLFNNSEDLNYIENEKNFVKEIIDNDSKNYHAWSYRQWFVKYFNCFENELDYVEYLLQKDFRNNSAWNYRFYILQNLNDFNNLNKRIEEMNYTYNYILKSPNNESSWNYLKGIATTTTINGNTEDEVLLLNHLEQLSRQVLEKVAINVHANYTLFISLIRKNKLDEALTICKNLEKFDFIRKKYWQHRYHVIEQQLLQQ